LAKVHTTTARTFTASADAVLAVLRDYEGQRPRMLPDAFTDYRFVSGDSKVVHYKLHATKRRIRTVEAEIAEEVSGAATTLVEADRNSTMRTRWRVEPLSSGTRVTVDVEWQGASGIGGIFEGLFAPAAMRGFLDQALERLAPLLASA
jgi:hypothetical protein